MSRPQFTSLRLSLLVLAVSATLPTFAFATETMTVTATGNARSSFEAPMMVSVIDTSAPENQTATSATDLLRHVPGITLDGTGRTNGQDVNSVAMIIAACWFLSMVFARERIPDT